MFNNNFDLNKHIEEEKLKAEEEAKKEVKKMNNKKETKSKYNKKSIKNLVEKYLENQGKNYNEWLAEKHQELLNEMIEKDILTLKGGK